jgi:hypothetical protein
MSLTEHVSGQKKTKKIQVCRGSAVRECAEYCIEMEVSVRLTPPSNLILKGAFGVAVSTLYAATA